MPQRTTDTGDKPNGTYLVALLFSVVVMGWITGVYSRHTHFIVPFPALKMADPSHVTNWAGPPNSNSPSLWTAPPNLCVQCRKSEESLSDQHVTISFPLGIDPPTTNYLKCQVKSRCQLEYVLTPKSVFEQFCSLMLHLLCVKVTEASRFFSCAQYSI